MATFESPTLYIDFSRLPPPKVIEDIDYEALVTIYQQRVLGKLPVLAKAMTLEQSPTNVVLQAEAYGEMMLRARINSAARAVMLPFATGSDLDNLASFFNQGRTFDVSRLPLVASPRDFTSFPDDWESDQAFRRRIQLAPEAFSTAGSAGSYIYHALSADPTVRDVSLTKINNLGGLRVSVMNSGSNPVPTSSQITAVTTRLFSKNIKPLTDVLSIGPVKVSYVDIDALVTLYPGPDQSLVVADIQAAMNKLRSRISLIGRDLTFSALHSALYQEGVQNVQIKSPKGDVAVGPDTCVWINSATINIAPTRME